MISKILKTFVLILALTVVTLVAQHPTMDPKTKDVPSVDYQEGPQVPTIDDYYLQGDPSQYIPDEFMSNPSGEVDPRELKGYHFPPQLKWVKVVSERQIKAGGTLHLEAQAENPVPTQRWWIAYQNQFGRRSTYRANFKPRADNPWLFDGVVQIDEWAEPGVYVVYDGELNSEIGHSKAFFPPMHPAMLNLEFEILPNSNVDVMYPDLVDLYIGEDENMNGASFDIGDMIPVRAKLFDNKSGASEVILRLSGPDNKYIELNLARRFNHPGEFVGYFQINQWSVGGEYVARTIQIKDKAGNQKDMFSSTNALLAAMKFNIRQDPARIDKVPPKLISVAFDRATAGMEDETKIVAIAVDDHSGIGDIWVDVGASPSWIDKKRIRLTPKAGRPLIKPGFDVKQNVYEGSFKTHKLDEPGDWVVSRVFVRDKANNYLDVRAAESPDLQTVKVVYGGAATASSQPAARSATTQAGPQTGGPAKIRRVDMIPPHPPRGPCLNCHEP